MLTDIQIRTAKPGARPVKLSDGGGLFLLVTPSGGKLWRLAYRFAGRQKTLAIGPYPVVTLAEARAARTEAKRLLHNGEDQTGTAVTERAPWSGAAPVRRIVGAAFTECGLPRFGPHSFRHLLGRLAQTRCETPEMLKAWSENLGHDQLVTTLMSYGSISDDRRRELLAG